MTEEKFDYDYSVTTRKIVDINGGFKLVEERAPDTVILIVRPGGKYSDAKEGQLVKVAASELKSKSTMQACMTIEERDEIAAKKEARAAETAAPKKSGIVAIVEAGIARLTAQPTGEVAK